MQTYPEWDRSPRSPVPPPPRRSCDAQLHVYGDASRYPLISNPLYQPPEATLSDAIGTLSVLGFERAVLVQPIVYGRDHRLLLDSLREASPIQLRGTAIVDDGTSTADLELLHSAGVRSARLNISRHFTDAPSEKSVARTLARLRDMGWHARLHVVGDDLLAYAHVLRAFHDVTFVIDHMGRIDLAEGTDGAAFQWILESLERENWWVMLSNGNRISRMEAGWDDAIPFGKALIAAAPDRMIWGSDWPHLQWTKRMMNDAEEVELLYRYADRDEGLLKGILVDNPARLFAF